jgi:hypothetical protein
MRDVYPNNRSSFVALGLSVAMLAVAVPPISAQAPDERLAAFKAALEEGLAKQRTYEWIETTVVSVKGDEKSRKQNRCYYGADGKVQKVPIEGAGNTGGSGKKPRGIRGKIVKNKKEGIEEAVKEAVALVKEYVPPSSEKIQTAKNDGRLSVSPPDGAGAVRMVIRDYLKDGDSVTVRFDSASNMLQGLDVATFMKKETQAVSLAADLSSLPDGTIYPASIVLKVKSENIRIDIENSGHRAASP